MNVRIDGKTFEIKIQFPKLKKELSSFNIHTDWIKSPQHQNDRVSILISLDPDTMLEMAKDLGASDEASLRQVTKNESTNNIRPMRLLSYGEFMQPHSELPATLVQFADQKIIELISIPSDEQSLATFKTRYSILDDKWIECIAIKKEYEDEKLILTSRKEGCTSCALGGLNRKYMKKLLPYLASEENMRFLYDAYLTLTFAEQLTDEQIEKSIQSKELQSIAKSIKKELVDRVNQKDENGNPVKACTSCEANRIKSKYIAMVKSVFDIVKQNWK